MKRGSEIPFRSDITSLFLPAMVMMMVYLASLALSGTLGINALVERWKQDISGSLTVQLLPAADMSEEKVQSRLETIMVLLKETPNVAEARILPESETRALLEPWLGEAALIGDLPLPRLVDITVRPDHAVDLQSLSDLLSEHAPEATLDSHRMWLSKLVSLARGIQVLAAVVLSLVLAGIAACVVYVTRTALAVHRDVIEVLHLIGAHDRYIARQFGRRTFMLSMIGGIPGFLLAIPANILVAHLAKKLGGGLISEMTFSPEQWGIVALVPLLTAFVATLSARTTVRKTLEKMP